MRYLPHTPREVAEMLEKIGLSSVEELFATVPETHRFDRDLALEPALSEPRLMTHLEELAHKNGATRMRSFLGAGAYDHHVPPAVDQLLLRSEFYTAYTPYQPEVSQGTLQAIFEFQTLVCELLGMEISNASMYDGASSAAEAALMARRVTDRSKIVVSAGLHPEYIETIRTYIGKASDDVVVAPLGADGRTDVAKLEALVDGQTAAVIAGYPNFFGVVEDLAALRAVSKAQGALLITATNEPYALSLIKPPGAYDVDIAVGDGQGLAVPPQFGGPGVGLFAVKSSFLRQMPGRVAGETVDADGKRGFVLTLSTREQHIRRERATSNICTNHGLIALAMTIRMAMLGKRGFKEAGELCLANAEFLKAKIRALPSFELPYSAPTFNEFVVRAKTRDASELLEALTKRGYLGGVALSRFGSNTSDFLVAVTELHSKGDLEGFAAALEAIGG
jgi:glycine dehydrogenase subunit 1